MELAKNQGWMKRSRKARVTAAGECLHRMPQDLHGSHTNDSCRLNIAVTAAADKTEWLKGTVADPAKKKTAGKQI